MDYQTYSPSEDLAPFIVCFWTLKGQPEPGQERQTILPDGCVDLAFILGDDVKRAARDNTFVIQPRSLLIGPMTEAFVIEPCGYVDTFGVRFYPLGFCHFIARPLADLADKDTPLDELFPPEEARALRQHIETASDTAARIELVGAFLRDRWMQPESLDRLTKATVQFLWASQGRRPIRALLGQAQAQRRQMERHFQKHIGLSPKRLGRAIRLQAALASLLSPEPDSLTALAYDHGYFDQAHFNHDFQSFTGTAPKAFGLSPELLLARLFGRRSES